MEWCARSLICHVVLGGFTHNLLGPNFQMFPFDLDKFSRCESSPVWFRSNNQKRWSQSTLKWTTVQVFAVWKLLFLGFLSINLWFWSWAYTQRKTTKVSWCRAMILSIASSRLFPSCSRKFHNFSFHMTRTFIQIQAMLHIGHNVVAAGNHAITDS